MQNYQFRRRSTKSRLVAVLLQCSPLLTVAGCTSAGVHLEISGNSLLNLLVLGFYFGWMVWGIGYAYLGEWGRFALALLGGPAFVIASLFLSFNGVHYDFEHGRGGDRAGFDRGLIEQAIIIAAANLLVIVDTLRLVARNNALVRQSPPPQPYYYYPPVRMPDPEMDEPTPAQSKNWDWK